MDGPKSLTWTADEIARFWDYWSGRSDTQESYFALQVGEGVVRFAEHVRALAGLDVLDFGSGPGHLIAHLLAHGSRVSAVDHSPHSVAAVEKRFAGQPGWGVAKAFDNQQLPWPDQSFDAVFCLETIEHLHWVDCRRIFDELFRVLRPRGFAVFTTPNEEDLQRQHVFCPSCNAEFHRWQHLRSWSSGDLSHCLEDHGYEVPFCRGINFHDFQPSSRRRLRWSSTKRAVRQRLAEWLDRILPRAFPQERSMMQRLRNSDGHHLVAVAFKPEVKAIAA